MKIEKRDNGEVFISGYVNAVDRESRVLHDKDGNPFVEVVRPKTFERALQNNNNVELRYNHEKHIGSTAENNLTLKEDNIGLYAEARIFDADIIDKVDNLTGWSFTFTSNKEDWDTKGKINKRYLDDIDLFEVSILDKTPAYYGTSVTSVEYRDGKADTKTVETRLLPALDEDNIPEMGEQIVNEQVNAQMPYTVTTTTADGTTVTVNGNGATAEEPEEEPTTDTGIKAKGTITKTETDNSILYTIKSMEIEIEKMK